jgi:hypothetical protein
MLNILSVDTFCATRRYPPRTTPGMSSSKWPLESSKGPTIQVGKPTPPMQKSPNPKDSTPRNPDADHPTTAVSSPADRQSRSLLRLLLGRRLPRRTRNPHRTGRLVLVPGLVVLCELGVLVDMKRLWERRGSQHEKRNKRGRKVKTQHSLKYLIAPGHKSSVIATAKSSPSGKISKLIPGPSPPSSDSFSTGLSIFCPCLLKSLRSASLLIASSLSFALTLRPIKPNHAKKLNPPIPV